MFLYGICFLGIAQFLIRSVPSVQFGEMSSTTPKETFFFPSMCT